MIMKTINLFAAMIAALIISVNANANNKSDMSEIRNDHTTSVMHKYNNVDGKKYKTVYSTDDMGRVTSKMIFTEGDGTWIPVCAYSVFYGDDENIVTYAAWNKSSKTFNKNAVQQHFNAKEYPVVIAKPE